MDMPTTTPTQAQQGFLEKMKSWLNWDALGDKKTILLNVALYSGLGFLTGFFLKKFSMYIALIVLILVGFIVLQQFDVINIGVNWARVHELFGIQVVSPEQGGIGNLILEWIRVNWVITISYFIGFLIGLRLG